MDQLSFADLEYENKKRKTRCEKFLERMDAPIPRTLLVKLLKKHYPRAIGASAVSAGDDTAHSLHAAVLQTVRSGHGRCPL